MPMQTVNGVDLYYEDTGGSGEPILFHHGYTGSHDTWLPIVSQLRDRYRCIVMDCRGAGDSSHPAEGYTLEQYALDVVAMADARGLDRFSYVGHSMGGAIGYHLGLDHAQRLERLVLVAPVGSGGASTPAAVREAARKLWYDRDEAELVRQRLDGAARPELNDEVVAKARVARTLSVSEGHFEQSWQSFAAMRLTERLGELTTPTLMVVGAADGLARPNLEDFLRLPNASIHVFHRVGHLIPTDVPEAFAELIADFMTNGVVTAKTLMDRIEAGKP
jgi:pimeloyl-ACP methyl ester carboxylesterase